EILHAVNAVSSTRGPLQRSWGLEVSFHDFNALSCQILSSGTTRVTRQCAEFPSVGEQAADHRSALPARGAGDEDCFVSIAHEARAFRPLLIRRQAAAPSVPAAPPAPAP